MSEGNGHVRVGSGAGRDPRDDGPGDRPGDGEPAGGPAAASGDGPDLHPWLRPRAALGVAAAVVVIGFAGWSVATWRVGEGGVVPCGSFTPSASLWRINAEVDPPVDGETPTVDYAPAASWPSVLRETKGTLECANLVGRSREQVELMMGGPTDTRDTEGTEVAGLQGGEVAWTASRDSPDAPDVLETVGVVVRFSSGTDSRAVSVRRFERRRAI